MSAQSSASSTPWPLGVVIPTFNRPDALLQCLAHLEAQSWKQFEVVVVDDGSTDDTTAAMESYLARTALTLRYVRQVNSGPASARNRGVSLLRSEVCLLIGDDIFASPQLVERHLALHRARPEPAVAGLGRTRWSETGQVVTPFMRWLDASGTQFAYGDLDAGALPSWRHFYTSNLSLKTEQLRRHPFREEFRRAAMEDVELGYRLAQRNELEVVYLPDALAEHLHPTSVGQACRRMITVGAAEYLFASMWPEQGAVSGRRHPLVTRVRDRMAGSDWVLERLSAAADFVTRFRCPNPVLRRALGLHHARGMRDAERAAAAKAQS